MEVKIGDWVRFEKGGTIVLGIVQYIDNTCKTFPYDIEALTDVGRVDISKILECRQGKNE